MKAIILVILLSTFGSFVIITDPFLSRQQTSAFGESEVRRLQSPYHIEVYTMPFCGHCNSVKEALRDANLKFETYSIFLNSEEHKEMLTRTQGNDGAPQIFINGYYIGSRGEFDRVVFPKLDSMKNNYSVLLSVKLRQ